MGIFWLIVFAEKEDNLSSFLALQGGIFYLGIFLRLVFSNFRACSIICWGTKEDTLRTYAQKMWNMDYSKERTWDLVEKLVKYDPQFCHKILTIMLQGIENISITLFTFLSVLARKENYKWIRIMKQVCKQEHYEIRT